MSQPRAEVLAHVAAQVELGTRPLLVAIDGGDGVGKTTFADDLATLLEQRGDTVVRASVDSFHHPRDHRHAHGRTGRTVWERTYDYRRLRQDLLDPWLRGAGSAYRLRWRDVATDALHGDALDTVPERAVLVVDGVFAQRPELAQAWDLVVWLEAPDEVRAARMAARDGSSPELESEDQARYADAQRIYRAACGPREAADVVVDLTDVDRPRVLTDEHPGDCPACLRPLD